MHKDISDYIDEIGLKEEFRILKDNYSIIKEYH